MEAMAQNPPIGLTIKRARERLRMTQAQLGERIGVSQKTIDNWEHDRRYPRSSIGALEDVLGISLDAPADDTGSANVVELRPDRDAVREIVHHAVTEYERHVSRREAREVPDSS